MKLNEDKVKARQGQIKDVMRALESYWMARPEFRLGQLIVNAADSLDPFYVPDFDLYANLSVSPKKSNE